MVGRSDCEIVDSLEAMARVMVQAYEVLHVNQNHNDGADEFRGLGKF